MSLRSQPFWWGVSLALLPGLLGLPAIGYAGVAVVNILWRLAFGRDSPEAIALVGGVIYGLAFGPLLQCLVVGVGAQLAWKFGLQRLSPRLARLSSPAKASLWIGAEALYLISFLWVLLALAAYSLPAVLSWLFNLGD